MGLLQGLLRGILGAWTIAHLSQGCVKSTQKVEIDRGRLKSKANRGHASNFDVLSPLYTIARTCGILF